VQLRMSVVGREAQVAAAAFGAHARSDGDRFKERGFAAPVLTNKEGHRLVEVKVMNGTDAGNAVRVDGSVLHVLPEHLRFDQPPVDALHFDHRNAVGPRPSAL
jgi:hypothetical protein